MKLLFITDNGFSYSNGEYYYNNANTEHYKLATRYFEDVVFIARNNNYDSSSNIIDKKYTTHLVDSITNVKKMIGNYIKIKKIIEKEIKTTDLVMCFGLNGNLAYNIAKKNKVPTFVFVGADHYEILLNIGPPINKLIAPLYKMINKKNIKKAEYVHYVSNDLLEKYPTNNKYIVSSDASIIVEKKIIDRRIQRILEKNTNDNIKIGLIGYTHNRIKGIDTAIRALATLGEGYELDIVGRGNPEWLVQIAEECKVNEKINFKGTMKREELFDWLDCVDIYIQPSRTEGMPRATLEAMSRGCATIGTKVGGLVDLIHEEDIIEIDDSNQLAKRIISIGQKKEKLIEKSMYSYRVATKYHPDILNDIKNTFYKEIISDIRNH